MLRKVSKKQADVHVFGNNETKLAGNGNTFRTIIGSECAGGTYVKYICVYIYNIYISLDTVFCLISTYQ